MSMTIVSASPGQTPRNSLSSIRWSRPDRDSTTLLATLVLGGYCMHLEAIEVELDDHNGLQEAVEPDYYGRIEDLHSGAGADGPFDTIEIEGRTYCLFATPYC
jgi:hypothetical protein